jgi:hypothetical protein
MKRQKKIKLLYLSAPICGNWFTSYILTKEMKRSVGMESHYLYPIALKKKKSGRRKWPTAERWEFRAGPNFRNAQGAYLG